MGPLTVEKHAKQSTEQETLELFVAYMKEVRIKLIEDWRNSRDGSGERIVPQPAQRDT